MHSSPESHQLCPPPDRVRSPGDAERGPITDVGAPSESSRSPLSSGVLRS